MNNVFVIIATITVYLGGMIYIGTYYSKKSSNTSEDFYLGSRKLNPLVAAMSAEASDMSSWLLMGVPGLAYFFGIAEAFWTCIGLAVGTYLNWLFVAKRLRSYTIVTKSITIPDFFSKRFHDHKNILCAIAASIIIIFFIPYTASGFSALGKLFNNLFGWDYITGMVIGGIVIIVYTVMGGFMAVSTTDLIQSIVMTIALTAILVFGINSAGGWSAVANNARSMTAYLELTRTTNTITKEITGYGALTIASTLAWGLGYFGMPHILLRFIAIDNGNKIKLSRRIACVWVTIAMGAAIVIGIVGNAMASNHSIVGFTTASASESIIIAISNLMASHGTFFAIVAGIVLSGILASTMSTADSQLLAAASSVSEDIVHSFFGISLSEKKRMLIARFSIVTISIIAIFLARNPNSSVFRIVSFAWAGFGASFGPLVLFSLFWKRTTLQGAIAGMVSGGAFVFIWKFLVRPLGGVLNIYELLPAFVISSIFIVVVSLLTENPSQEIQDEFEEAKKEH